MSNSSEDAILEAVPLLGDGFTQGIVRIGSTVRRPKRPFTETVHRYLQHLHDQGFDAAPVPLGFDDLGREKLTYVVGDVPREPLPTWATTVDVIQDIARLIRRLHDSAQDWEPPADAVWGSIPGDLPDGFVPMFSDPELVSHADYCPGNVVFREQRPVALIDFDLARPTTRVVDVIGALYWWAPFLHPLDRAPSLQEADIPARVRAFVDAYGMDADQRSQIVPLGVRRAHNTHLTMREAARVNPVFQRWWDEGVKDRLPRAEAWWKENASTLSAALA